MKIGVRKPSIKKRIKARTTAKAKRAAKGAINPLYGKKGMGWVNDPKKAMYNKVYNKTTISVDDLVCGSGASKSANIHTNLNKSTQNSESIVVSKGLLIFLAILFFPFTIVYFIIKLYMKLFKFIFRI